MAVRKAKTPWLDTAIDITKVLGTNEEGKLTLGGKVIPQNQVIQLKSEAELLGKMSLWPVLIETIRQDAIRIGLVSSTNFDHVLTAKSLLYLLDWQRSWTETIRKVKLEKN